MSLDVGNLRFILSLQLCSPSNIPSDCVNVNLSKTANEVSFFFSTACLSVTLYCIHFMNQLKSLFLCLFLALLSLFISLLFFSPPHSRRFSFSPAVSLFIILSLSYTFSHFSLRAFHSFLPPCLLSSSFLSQPHCQPFFGLSSSRPSFDAFFIFSFEYQKNILG